MFLPNNGQNTRFAKDNFKKILNIVNANFILDI